MNVHIHIYSCRLGSTVSVGTGTLSNDGFDGMHTRNIRDAPLSIRACGPETVACTEFTLRLHINKRTLQL